MRRRRPRTASSPSACPRACPDTNTEVRTPRSTSPEILRSSAPAQVGSCRTSGNLGSVGKRTRRSRDVRSIPCPTQPSSRRGCTPNEPGSLRGMPTSRSRTIAASARGLKPRRTRSPVGQARRRFSQFSSCGRFTAEVMAGLDHIRIRQNDYGTILYIAGPMRKRELKRAILRIVWDREVYGYELRGLLAAGGTTVQLSYLYTLLKEMTQDRLLESRVASGDS